MMEEILQSVDFLRIPGKSLEFLEMMEMILLSVDFLGILEMMKIIILPKDFYIILGKDERDSSASRIRGNYVNHVS